MMIEREERERDRPDLIFILSFSLLLPPAAQIHFFSFSPSLPLSPIPESSFQCRCSFLLARFGMLCDWAGGERKGRWTKGDYLLCPFPSLLLSLFLPQLLNAGVHPSRAREREKGIVSPTLEHGEMKWPLLPLFSPSPASLRFNKL